MGQARFESIPTQLFCKANKKQPRGLEKENYFLLNLKPFFMYFILCAKGLGLLL